jgi:hypothetical protein
MLTLNNSVYNCHKNKFKKIQINSTKEIKDFYNEDSKTFKKEVEDIIRGSDLPYSWIMNKYYENNYTTESNL